MRDLLAIFCPGSLSRAVQQVDAGKESLKEQEHGLQSNLEKDTGAASRAARGCRCINVRSHAVVGPHVGTKTTDT